MIIILSLSRGILEKVNRKADGDNTQEPELPWVPSDIFASDITDQSKDNDVTVFWVLISWWDCVMTLDRVSGFIYLFIWGRYIKIQEEPIRSDTKL